MTEEKKCNNEEEEEFPDMNQREISFMTQVKEKNCECNVNAAERQRNSCCHQ